MSDAARGVVYADTSALVKLVIREAESNVLAREMTNWRGMATSTIAAIELHRAVGRARDENRESVADAAAVAVLLGAVAEIPLTSQVRSIAGALQPVELRTLDAIHLASALVLGDDLNSVVTYDHRMTAAATQLGLRVSSPT